MTRKSRRRRMRRVSKGKGEGLSENQRRTLVVRARRGNGGRLWKVEGMMVVELETEMEIELDWGD